MTTFRLSEKCSDSGEHRVLPNETFFSDLETDLVGFDQLMEVNPASFGRRSWIEVYSDLGGMVFVVSLPSYLFLTRGAPMIDYALHLWKKAITQWPSVPTCLVFNKWDIFKTCLKTFGLQPFTTVFPDYAWYLNAKLCAMYIASQFQKETTRRIPAMFTTAIDLNCMEETWDEIFLLMAGVPKKGTLHVFPTNWQRMRLIFLGNKDSGSVFSLLPPEIATKIARILNLEFENYISRRK